VGVLILDWFVHSLYGIENLVERETWRGIVLLWTFG
jgi:hypothetical protein